MLGESVLAQLQEMPAFAGTELTVGVRWNGAEAVVAGEGCGERVFGEAGKAGGVGVEGAVLGKQEVQCT